MQTSFPNLNRTEHRLAMRKTLKREALLVSHRRRWSHQHNPIVNGVDALTHAQRHDIYVLHLPSFQGSIWYEKWKQRSQPPEQRCNFMQPKVSNKGPHTAEFDTQANSFLAYVQNK